MRQIALAHLRPGAPIWPWSVEPNAIKLCATSKRILAQHVPGQSRLLMLLLLLFLY